MKVTIIPEDSKVILDGVAYEVSVPADPSIHAIQWHGDRGVIERKFGGAESFTDFAVIQPWLDAWQAAHAIATALPPVAPWNRDKSLKKVRAGREIALNRLAGIAFAAKEAGDAPTVTACLAARAALLDITTLPAVLAATDDASLTVAVGTAYAGIVAAAPANIKAAFAGIQS